MNLGLWGEGFFVFQLVGYFKKWSQKKVWLILVEFFQYWNVVCILWIELI